MHIRPNLVNRYLCEMPDLSANVNIHETINSGQVFLWENHKNVWFGIDGSDVIQVKHEPFEILTLSKEPKDFFRNDDNYKKILKSISHDKIVKNAVKHYPGLRITRQDPFQCCISFIISANSNIPNIKTRLQKLCRKFGTRVNFDQREFFIFPEPHALANASINDLQECGLGYRTKYVKDTSFFVDTGEIDFDYLKKTDYQTVKESLLKLPGIGDKVADCIMLFSLEKLEAFPLDTWILKILQKYYSDKFHIEEKLTKKKYENTRQQILNHFGMYSGYSQQFLFKMERDLNEKKWL